MKDSKIAGLLVILIVYTFAIIFGINVFLALTNTLLPHSHIFLRILIADVAATIFVFLCGVVLKNTSVYDPYWSVAPIVILTGIAFYVGFLRLGLVASLLLYAVWFWGIRLTINWAYTFKNLSTQDWRYDMFKQKFPRIYQLISFCGINMMPTLVVYLCLLPGIMLIQENIFRFCIEPGGSIAGGAGLMFTSRAHVYIGFAICIIATLIQLASDIQMHRFRRKNTENNLIIRHGLWKHSRHPNYLGEILMWWGVYVMMLSLLPHMWYLGIGALVNTLMFLFISIPMADKRNRTIRDGFDEYYRETNSLMPFRKFNRK